MLLKNDGALPLGNYDKISVFGMNSVDLVYGGTGSAEKDSGDSVDLYKEPGRLGHRLQPGAEAVFMTIRRPPARAAPRVPAWAIS